MPSRYTIATEFMNPLLEKKLLAAIIAKPELYWEVCDLISLDSLTQIQQEFAMISESIEQEKPLPVLDIKEEPVENPVEAAKEIAKLYQKRLLADLLQDSLENLRTESPAPELISQLESHLVKVQQAVQELKTGQVVAWPDLFPQVLKDVQAKREAVKETGKVSVGLPTGIPKLDRLLGGLQQGVHLLAAEPGQGKTTLALQISQNIAQEGYPVLFVSFEESLMRLALKTICQVASLDMKPFADGYAESAQLEQAAKIHGVKLQNLHFLEGNKKVTVAQIKAKSLQIMAKAKSQKCLVVIDYIQKMAASNRDFADFRHIVASLVSDLRELAMRLESPIVVISSQNRSGQGKAQLTSLKESGDLEYSADTALFLVESERKATPPCRAIDLMLEKNRYGDKGKISLIFKPTTGSFFEEARR